MADHEIKFILQAQDFASQKFAQLSDNVKASGKSAGNFVSDFAPLIATGGVVAATLMACVDAANKEEQAITDGARAAANAVGSFDVAKQAITQLNDEMEAIGFETDDTAQAFQLLVNSGRSVEQAMDDTVDILATAADRHISVQKAVKILLREEGEYADALKEKNRELDGVNDKISEYSDTIAKLNEQLGMTKSEERALRDLNTSRERAVQDITEAQDEQTDRMKEADKEVMRAQLDVNRINQEHAADQDEEARKQEKLVRAQERLQDATDRRNRLQKDGEKEIADLTQRVGDIDQDIADKKEDIADRQKEVNDKLTEYKAKMEEAQKAASDLTTQIDSLKTSQDKEIETIKNANEVRELSVTGMEKQKQAANKVENAMEAVGRALRPLTDSLLDQIVVAFDWLAGKDPIGDLINRIGAVAGASGNLLVVSIQTFVIEPVATAMSEFFTSIKDKWDKLWDDFSKSVNEIGATVKKNIEQFITDVTKAFTDFVAKGIQWGIDLINNFAKGIEDAINSVSGWVKNIIQGGSKVSVELTQGAEGLAASGVVPLAAGGIITQPTLALLGEGGENEYVIPEHKLAGLRGGAPTFVLNLNVAGNIDEKNREFVVETVQQEFATLWRSQSR